MSKIIRSTKEIEEMKGLINECYESITDLHEKNELQAALTILRFNYTEKHYVNTPYSKITKRCMEWLINDQLTEVHILEKEN